MELLLINSTKSWNPNDLVFARVDALNLSTIFQSCQDINLHGLDEY